MNLKDNQGLYFLATTIILITFFAVGYLFLFEGQTNSENGRDGHDQAQIENNDETPDNLGEGFIAEIHDSYLLVNMKAPNEVAEERLRFYLTGSTTYRRLNLDVYGLGNVEPAGEDQISINEIEVGDEVLISATNNIVDTFQEGEEFEAVRVTKINARNK